MISLETKVPMNVPFLQLVSMEAVAQVGLYVVKTWLGVQLVICWKGR